MEGLVNEPNACMARTTGLISILEGLKAAIRGPNLKYPTISAIILGWTVFTLMFLFLKILLYFMPDTTVLLLLIILPASLGNTATYTRMKWNQEAVEEMGESQDRDEVED